MPSISAKKPYRIGRSRTGLGLFATKPIKKGAEARAERLRLKAKAEKKALKKAAKAAAEAKAALKPVVAHSNGSTEGRELNGVLLNGHRGTSARRVSAAKSAISVRPVRKQ